jgi:hypothetical protein
MLAADAISRGLPITHVEGGFPDATAFFVTYFVGTAFPKISLDAWVVGDQGSKDSSPSLHRHKDWPRRFSS